MHQLTFYVPGTGVAQGSKRHVGNGVMIENNKKKNDAWRNDVRLEAQKALAALPEGAWGKQFDAALVMTVAFYFTRPKSHYRTGRYKDQLKPDMPMYKTSTPDCDKLLRSVSDALTGLVYKDDSQLVDYRGVKFYGTPPGARITVYPAEV